MRILLEKGFVLCDNPQVAETAYNRHKYINRLLCWISPQLLYTSILNKPKTTGSVLPLRVLTATLADRVSSLINTRHLSSPTKVDPRDYYDNSTSTLASPDPLVTLRNSVYWQSSPGKFLDWTSSDMLPRCLIARITFDQSQRLFTILEWSGTWSIGFVDSQPQP